MTISTGVRADVGETHNTTGCAWITTRAGVAKGRHLVDSGHTPGVATWTEAYVRCMDGEFFRGAYCPRDGHSNETSLWIARAVTELRQAGGQPSLDQFVRRGFSGDLSDVLVIEFATEHDVPDWFRPEG